METGAEFSSSLLTALSDDGDMCFVEGFLADGHAHWDCGDDFSVFVMILFLWIRR